MSWDRKRSGKNFRRYYYCSRRVGARVKKEYIGCGKVGAQAAAQDARVRLSRAEQQARLSKIVTQIEQAQEPLDRLCWLSRVLLQAVLIRAGCYIHARSEWRRRRADHGRT